MYRATGSWFSWRCTTRVDNTNITAFETLADAGLKVVDFGLESASVSQLLKMNKTKNPEAYLKNAENIIRSLSERGVWSKLNILLYAGETLETFNETRSWLLRNKHYIKGISANPLTIYLNGKNTSAYCDEIERLTGSKIDRAALYSTGLIDVDLSPEIGSEYAKKLCNELCGAVMSEEDYLDLKRICYMPRTDNSNYHINCCKIKRRGDRLSFSVIV